jgi:hypothetical protein
MKNTSSPDFGKKLILTMQVVGTVTQKQLHARLLAVNPDTCFRPERAYKWIKGRASPRDPSIFDDLALLLDLQANGKRITGATLSACDYPTFRDLVFAQYGNGVPAEELRSPQRSGFEGTIEHGGNPSRQLAVNDVPAFLAGTYLVLSRSWSMLQRNHLLVAEMILDRRPDGLWAMEYLERLPGGPLHMIGNLYRIGRNLQVSLNNFESENTIAMTLSAPPAPGVMLSGVMSGSALHDTEMRPMAGRVVCLAMRHLKPSADMQDPGSWRFGFAEGTTYLASSADAISARLRDSGIDSDLASRIAPDIADLIIEDSHMGVIDITGDRVSKIIGTILT